MKSVDLFSFLADVERRKRALGFDESQAAVDALRNKGGRRSPAKRAMLRRTEQRARAAGFKPTRSFY